MNKISFALAGLFLLTIGTKAQQNKFRVSLVGFYNLENLYDTINDPFKDDEEFLPGSERQYNGRIYWDKISHLSEVISQMGTDINPEGLAMLGVAEIENDTVLNDLVKSAKLKDRKLKYVHYNNPIARGK